MASLLDSAIATITPNSLSDPSSLSFLADGVARLVATAKPVTPNIAPLTAPFSTIYAFGDSLTDAGNDSLASFGLAPVSPPYANRVFSNGPTWLQDLAPRINLPPIQPSLNGGTDFAFGGARTGPTPIHASSPLDLPAQIANFNTQVDTPQPNALYAIWIGSNDVLDIANNTTITPQQQQADVVMAVTNETAAIQALIASGAKNFLVLNVPDLGKTPAEAGLATAPIATALSTQYNAVLATAIQGLASGGVKMDLIDTAGLLNMATADPAKYGFTNVTDPAWTGNLTDSTSGTLAPGNASYLYFDRLHPTALTHSLLADNVQASLGVLA